MKAILAILISSSILLFACGKDKFETKPRIEIKSYNSKEIPVNGQLTMRLNFFDKEGDLGGGDFWLARYRLNVRPLGSLEPNLPDTLDVAHGYTVPVFPAKDKGEVFIQLNYNNFLKESTVQNDTIYFRIAVSDKAGNKSDTIDTEKIVILLP